MRDASACLPPGDQQLMKKGDLAELLYADDTLLLSISAHSLERFLVAVSQAGAACGLELHWGKLQLMRVRSDEQVHRPDGSIIDSNEDMTYLGSLVSEEGRASRELLRRIGIAHSELLGVLRNHDSQDQAP